MTDPIRTLFDLGLGPWLMPLRGKLPVLDGWPTLPAFDEETVRSWVAQNWNLGLRTGSRSGLVVIDDDQAKHGASGFVAPPTGLVVATPTGGRHFYYRCPAVPPGNSASKIAPYVDLRGEGGQVVVPPSVHPNTGTAYVWLETGEPGVLPASVVPAPAPQPARPDVDMRAPVPSISDDEARYAQTALHRETHAVRNATEGTRNSTLNRAAFSLGQLVATGALPPETVRADLLDAATLAGLPQDEAAKTIASGMRGGAAHPRAVPQRPSAATATAPAPAPRDTRPAILVPGSHMRKGGEYIEQGNDSFAAAVIQAIDGGQLYRRSGVIGEVQHGQFMPCTLDRLRSLIDRSVRLIASKQPKSDGSESDPIEHYRPCLRDHAAIVSNYAAIEGSVRELKHVSDYPVCAGTDFLPCTPGWNPDTGVYLHCDETPTPLPLDEAKAVLADLTCDFPWATPADRANYYGLLLTVVVRPAIGEPVPMHLIGAPVAGSGKSKLAEIVLGCGVLGQPLPATQIGVREEEREKRILGAMLSGRSVINLDNLTDFVDSAALASLLTCSQFNGRELGHSRMVSLPNDSTVVASGNNVHTTDEIARRIVPIMLQPDIESPENRQDYRHPDLRGFVTASRPRILAALFGLIAHWRDHGRPLGSRSIGSFERWSATVGGIMHHAGYTEWGANLSTWRTVADDTNAELRAFVSAWLDAYGTEPATTTDLFTLATSNDLFERRLNQSTDQGRKVAFGQRLLVSFANRIVSGHRIVVEGEGKRRRARLVAVS